MKFAKELDENAIPEWRDKYLDYKGGKKKLKAVSRAIRSVNPSNNSESIRNAVGSSTPFASIRDGPVYSFLKKGGGGAVGQRQRGLPANGNSNGSNTPLVEARGALPVSHQRSRSHGEVEDGERTPRPNTLPVPVPVNERSPLHQARTSDQGARMTRYGSIIGSPDEHQGSGDALGRIRTNATAPSLELPQPAMDEEDGNVVTRTSTQERAEEDADYDRTISPGSAETASNEQAVQPPATQLAHRGDAYTIARPTDLQPTPTSSAEVRRRRFGSLFSPRRSNSMAGESIALEQYRELEFRQAEFFLFLDKELLKIENFYKSKEDAANVRLEVLREQLHVMRERRLEEVLEAQGKKRPVPQARRSERNVVDSSSAANQSDAESGNETKHGIGNDLRHHPLQKSMDVTREALERMKTGRVGKTSKAMGELGSPQVAANPRQAHQDYTRKDVNRTVPYRSAKRKLKLAMAEFYRGLELLKSYAMLNRTAMRKICKKFDKTASSADGKNYMKDKVNNAHFVQSDSLDTLIQSVEDLYARYFERGNRKVAVGKLRQKIAKEGAFYGPTIRTGILLGVGTVFGVQGLVYGTTRLLDEPERWPGEHTQTAYLLQIYAGYFLIWLLTLIFCIDAAIFAKYRVNYQFIFEFDTRHMLDWKELFELPAWFGFAFGLALWANFSFWCPESFFVYWPVILVAVSLVMFFAPPPTFYWRSRVWFLVSNARLLAAGVYPVEFRDFFLGDMYCSQTYAIGNVELFFCLYARHWRGVEMCNSSHSRLFGFFQTLPGIWRLFQCFRRYYDTRLWTHLANGAKYTCTILQYMSLSIWRIHHSTGTLAFFILCASLNSIYCSFWDLQYDWSMPLNPYSKPHPFLRDVLAYRKHAWWYYAAMLIDPIIRCNWIFYLIFMHDAQHSSIVSFVISLSEVLRRGMWVLLRVENEHCTNVGRYRAQRDPALPYEIDHPASSRESLLEPPQDIQQTDGSTPAVSGRDLEGGSQPASGSILSMRRRRGTKPASGEEAAESPVYRALKRAGTTFMAAHAMDYEKKRRPAEEERDGILGRDGETDDEDEDSE